MIAYLAELITKARRVLRDWIDPDRAGGTGEEK
jgi:hypothetical protein